MTLQADLQTITAKYHFAKHTYCQISHHVMVTRQCHLIGYNKRNIFHQKLCRKECREASTRPLFVFLKKALCEVKASGLKLSFNIFQ